MCETQLVHYNYKWKLMILLIFGFFVWYHPISDHKKSNNIMNKRNSYIHHLKRGLFSSSVLLEARDRQNERKNKSHKITKSCQVCSLPEWREHSQVFHLQSSTQTATQKRD